MDTRISKNIGQILFLVDSAARILNSVCAEDAGISGLLGFLTNFTFPSKALYVPETQGGGNTHRAEELLEASVAADPHTEGSTHRGSQGQAGQLRLSTLCLKQPRYRPLTQGPQSGLVLSRVPAVCQCTVKQFGLVTRVKKKSSGNLKALLPKGKNCSEEPLFTLCMRACVCVW